MKSAIKTKMEVINLLSDDSDNENGVSPPKKRKSLHSKLGIREFFDKDGVINLTDEEADLPILKGSNADLDLDNIDIDNIDTDKLINNLLETYVDQEKGTLKFKSDLKAEETNTNGKSDPEKMEVDTNDEDNNESKEPESLLTVLREEDYSISVNSHKNMKHINSNGSTSRSRSPVSDQEENSKDDEKLETASFKSTYSLNNAETESVASSSSTAMQTEASCSKSVHETELPTKLEEFIKLCCTNIGPAHDKLQSKINSLRNSAKYAPTYLASQQFTEDLNAFETKIFDNPKQTAKVFVDLYLKFEEKKDEILSKNSKIQRLEKKLKEVEKVIQEQGDAEVDFDDEQNSSFFKYRRYQNRAAAIYKKICELNKKDQHHGFAYFSRLDFDKSSYNEFNLVINKKFGNGQKVPDIHDMDKCLRKCANQKNVEISDSELNNEITFCFKSLIHLLKKRRIKDFQSGLSVYQTKNIDPAQEDTTLEEKLRENKKDATTKLNEILQKYTKMQETGIEPELSEDSDESQHETTDEEDA